MKNFFLLFAIIMMPINILAQLNTSETPKSKSEFKSLEARAKNGDLHAQYIIGCCYLQGVPGVVSQSSSKAEKLFRKAADNGDADACRMMFKMNPEKNYAYHETATRYYKNIGNGKACYYLADLNSVFNQDVMMRWLRTSSDKGYKPATTQLQRIYDALPSARKTDYTLWLSAIEPMKDIVATVEDVAEENEVVDEEYDGDDIDNNIPTWSGRKNEHTLVLIIGNEKYDPKSPGIVEFAENDAKTFANYCMLTLGIPRNNVRVRLNPSDRQWRSLLSDAAIFCEADPDAEVIFYYAGHGRPSEDGKSAYLIPTDANVNVISECYPIDDLYAQLGALGAKNVLVLLDACFSGTKRDGSLMAQNQRAFGIAVKHEAHNPRGNMMVMSAAQGDQTSLTYKKKRHGLFTYCLLKKLQESKGGCTLGELNDYVASEVKRIAGTTFSKRQHPDHHESGLMVNTWQSKRLR